VTARLAAGGAGLVAAVRVTRGAFSLDVELVADPGEVLALVGPNGAGKTTLLRALAGLEPAEGHVRIDGQEVNNRAPQDRRTGWVPQDGALFAHLSVAANVAFGPRARGAGRRAAAATARDWLDRLDLAPFAERRPTALSGGQAQRVALARALAGEPRLLLLDEPLAALDAQTRTQVRRAMREHLRSFDGVTLLVTHEPLDALTLAGRLVVLDAGRVVQDAPPAAVARNPGSPWVARLFGANAYSGTLTDRGLRLDGAGGLLIAAEPAGPAGAPGLAVVPPAAVALHPQRPTGSARNCWAATVAELTPVGPSRVRVLLTRDRSVRDGVAEVVAEVTPAAVADLGLHEGVPLWVSVKATEVRVTPR